MKKAKAVRKEHETVVRRSSKNSSRNERSGHGGGAFRFRRSLAISSVSGDMSGNQNACDRIAEWSGYKLFYVTGVLTNSVPALHIIASLGLNFTQRAGPGCPSSFVAG